MQAGATTYSSKGIQRYDYLSYPVCCCFPVWPKNMCIHRSTYYSILHTYLSLIQNVTTFLYFV